MLSRGVRRLEERDCDDGSAYVGLIWLLQGAKCGVPAVSLIISSGLLAKARFQALKHASEVQRYQGANSNEGNLKHFLECSIAQFP